MAQLRHAADTLSVAMFDIDHFKQLNDSQGHQAGDQLLRDLCAFIRQQLGSEDHFGRYGGDEFLLIFRDRTLQETHQLMERIHQGVGQALGTGLSIGIAGFQTGDSSQQLIHRADSALYQAKRAGRNRIALCADGSLEQRVFHP